MNCPRISMPRRIRLSTLTLTVILFQHTFFRFKGRFEGKIPDKVQKMFNREYGIKVGYNAKTKMLYYAGEG